MADSELPLMKRIKWINFIFLLIVPLGGAIATLVTPLCFETAAWFVITYIWTGLGVTAGYHRLWAHRAYSASLPLRLCLALGGSAGVQGSIRWWSRKHRAHHRHLDTESDPYSMTKGFLHAHIGWAIVNNPEASRRTRHIDVSDLDADPVVYWQDKLFVPLVLLCAYIMPTVVAGLGWNDWQGGFVYAAILRTFCVQQTTFCVNSVAHWLGDQTFDDRNTSRDNIITALVTFGEGYHNFHHEFPSDYRNAVEWYQFDPTKWVIYTCSLLGYATHLKRFRVNEIEMGRIQQQQKALDVKSQKITWGKPLHELPVLTWDEFETLSKEKMVIVIANVVYDVGEFVDRHPGGKGILAASVGKDATTKFFGGVYRHSNAAENLLQSFRMAVLSGHS